MEINKEFLKIILPVLEELKNKLKGDFVVFGSTPLYLFGVLEFKELHDIDIAVRDESIIPSGAKLILFADNPKQRLYKFRVKDINIDIGSAWPGQEEIFNRIFQDPIIIEGIKFANLDIIREWKELMVKEYDRQKDKDHLEKIKIFKEKL